MRMIGYLWALKKPFVTYAPPQLLHEATTGTILEVPAKHEEDVTTTRNPENAQYAVTVVVKEAKIRAYIATLVELPHQVKIPDPSPTVDPYILGQGLDINYMMDGRQHQQSSHHAGPCGLPLLIASWALMPLATVVEAVVPIFTLHPQLAVWTDGACCCASTHIAAGCTGHL